jgi:lysophospholipase L1-like esterase
VQVRTTERALALAGMMLLAQLPSLPVQAQSQAQEATGDARQRGRVAVEKDLARHRAFLARKDSLIRTGGTQLVFVGDSITDSWRADPQREIFEDYFGKYRPYNIGISADETQHVLWRIQHGELDGLSPKLVVLMIGTNNLANANRMSPKETADGVAVVVAAIRSKLPTSKVLLLGIFPRANRADDPLRLAVNATNKLIAPLHDGRTVFYRDLGASFLGSDGTLSGEIMPDYLHPNAKGYQIWADAIKAEVDSLTR